MPSRHAIAAAGLATCCCALVPPAPAAHRRVTARRADELPEVAPGEVDWDAEFKRLKRGEVGNTAKLNEVANDVERTGRVAKQKASTAARSVTQGARRAAKSVPKGPSLSNDAKIWFAVIAALAFLPALINALSVPVQASGAGGVYV